MNGVVPQYNRTKSVDISAELAESQARHEEIVEQLNNEKSMVIFLIICKYVLIGNCKIERAV